MCQSLSLLMLKLAAELLMALDWSYWLWKGGRLLLLKLRHLLWYSYKKWLKIGFLSILGQQL